MRIRWAELFNKTAGARAAALGKPRSLSSLPASPLRGIVLGRFSASALAGLVPAFALGLIQGRMQGDTTDLQTITQRQFSRYSGRRPAGCGLGFWKASALRLMQGASVKKKPAGNWLAGRLAVGGGSGYCVFARKNCIEPEGTTRAGLPPTSV